MNYYRRYPGDYGAATAHLSLAEHGAYTLILDLYYSTETPLPASLDLCRICRATTSAERRAVRKVADEFFPIEGDVRRNRRADEELGVALKKIASARENGKLGGRPAKNPPDNRSKTGAGTDRVSEPEPVPNHPPITNLQPLASIPQPREARAADGQDSKPTPVTMGRGWWKSDAALVDACSRLGKSTKGKGADELKAVIDAALEDGRAVEPWRNARAGAG